MRVLRAILAYAVVVIGLGALLSPWVYTQVHPYLPRVPFRRVFDRTLLGVALVGLWPMLRALDVRSLRELGYPPQANWWRATIAGLGLGLLSLGVAGGLLWVTGVREIAHAPVPWGAIIVTGVAVAVVEETFFRGALFGALGRGWGAVVVTSALYSVVHFFKPKSAEYDPIVWTTGFSHLAFVVRYSWQQPGVALGVVTLFLAGCTLALARLRTGALYLSIGLHAGWVMAMKSFSKLTDPVGQRQWWGGGSLLDNMIAWPVLLLLLWGISRWQPRS